MMSERYQFPNPRRRRAAGWVYLLVAVAVATLLEPSGRWVSVVLLVALAAWHFWSAFDLAVDEAKALSAAATQVGFPVGHASAAVGFRGWRSRPEWQVILYSADEPPSQRALVRVDGISGGVVGETYIEQIEQFTDGTADSP